MKIAEVDRLENFINRYCEYQKDRENLRNFILLYRAARDLRLYPTVWRFFLLLTSRVWDHQKNTQIWQRVTGEIIAFVMIWQRYQTSPYLVIDGFIHPNSAQEHLLQLMFEWANQRVQDIAFEKKTRLDIYVNGFSIGNFAEQLRTQYGYKPVLPKPDDHNVYFSKELTGNIEIPSLPPGYRIRYLQGEKDRIAYEELFGFAQVNPMHQNELLESDEYRQIVIERIEGVFVAYCECSICRAEWEMTNFQIGWIDYIETKSNYQRKGLGQVALMAGLAQLKKWGANVAMLVTVNSNNSAVALYKKQGFQKVQVEAPLVYEKEITIENNIR